jgi:hypothetical protein
MNTQALALELDLSAKRGAGPEAQLEHWGGRKPGTGG